MFSQKVLESSFSFSPLANIHLCAKLCIPHLKMSAVGVINGAFSDLRITSENASRKLHCPYNVMHKIEFQDFGMHVDRCPSAKDARHLLEQCPYNSVHYFSVQGKAKEAHLKICPNIRVLPQAKQFPEETKSEELPAKVVPHWRERRGIDNPRVRQPPLPPYEVVLGPDYEQLFKPKKLSENEIELIRRHEETKEYLARIFEHACSDVVQHGWKSYADCVKYTSLMSPAEKVRFAKFLDDQHDAEEQARRHLDTVNKLQNMRNNMRKKYN